MRRNYTVKGLLPKTEPALGVVKGKEGVFVGGKVLVLDCTLGDDLNATAEQIKGTRLCIDHFGFDTSEYFVYVSEDQNWRKASAVCTPTGYQIDSATYRTGKGYVRFAHLRHFVLVEACFFLDRNKQPVCLWDVTEVGFDKYSKTANSIKVREIRESLNMPAKLADRFVMIHCDDPLPKREDLTAYIRQYLGGKTNMPLEVKDKFMKLADVLALTYLNAWGAHEKLAVKETTAQAPVQPSNVLEFPAPEQQEVKPETKAPESIAATASVSDPQPVDPYDQAGQEARAAKGDKTSRGRRKGSKKPK